MNNAPLTDLRVLVTRPREQADRLCTAIESAGGTAVRFPVMRISPRDENQVRAELSALPKADIVIFVSHNAAVHGTGLFSASDAIFAAVGRTTATTLAAAGIEVTIDPGSGYTSEALLVHESLQRVAGRNVLIVRGDDGRALIGDTLSARGAKVDYLAVYGRGPTEPGADAIDRLVSSWQSGGIDCVTVLSTATLEYLVAIMPDSSLPLLRQTPLVAPGERVVQTAGRLVPGMPSIQASGPLPEDIVGALVEWRHSGKNP